MLIEDTRANTMKGSDASASGPGRRRRDPVRVIGVRHQVWVQGGGGRVRPWRRITFGRGDHEAAESCVEEDTRLESLAVATRFPCGRIRQKYGPAACNGRNTEPRTHRPPAASSGTDLDLFATDRGRRAGGHDPALVRPTLALDLINSRMPSRSRRPCARRKRSSSVRWLRRSGHRGQPPGWRSQGPTGVRRTTTVAKLAANWLSPGGTGRADHGGYLPDSGRADVCRDHRSAAGRRERSVESREELDELGAVDCCSSATDWARG